jgi:hypothetical protein
LFYFIGWALLLSSICVIFFKKVKGSGGAGAHELAIRHQTYGIFLIKSWLISALLVRFGHLPDMNICSHLG